MSDLKINPVNLDFDSIKKSLKDYLKSQEKFKDYNFEGSGMAILLDVLAANTQYNGFMANMLANESFLDSAQLRSSVVSLAKMLNYVPSSRSAPVAMLNVQVSNVSGNPSSITIEKGYRFISTIDGVSYSFVPVSAQTIMRNTSNRYVTDLTVYQGQFVSVSSLVDNSVVGQKFVIPAQNVDLSFLKVLVYPSGTRSGTPVEYTLASDITEVLSISRSYFLQENQEGYYEVYFGDNVVGAKPSNGSLVVLEYLITDGEAANEASVFTKSTNIANSSNILITTISPASGGAYREGIESIKLLAPKFNVTQNRAVTTDDFATIIRKKYPAVDSVAVWGGEDNDPVSYGEVFIALKPKGSTLFSDTFKQKIADDLKTNYMVVAVRPRIIDPDYVYVIVDSKVTYDSLNTNRTENEIVSLVNSSIDSFFESSLNDFEKTLRYSKLVAAIDASATEIKGNYTSLKLKKSITPTLNVPRDYAINFSNPIAPYSLSSNEFTIQGIEYKLKDVPNGSAPFSTGNIVIYRTINNSDVIIQSNLGIVDYSSGKITLNSFAPNTISIGRNIDIIVRPSTSTLSTDISAVDYNIYTNKREQIIVRDALSSTITAISELKNE